MPDQPARTRVLAGDCTVRFEGAGERGRLQRGRVVVLVKPDRTVLVHDADGYQPAAWLTRPDAVTVEADAGGFAVTARAGERTLRVVSHGPGRRWTAPVGPAGVPVGACPRCADGDGDPPDHGDDGGGALVRTRGEVVCVDCGDRHDLPAGATVLDATCADCGLPLLRVERGAVMEVCLDRARESLADAVRGRLDRRWPCPDCGRDLRVRVRGRGDRLFLSCDGPDCEAAFPLPAGVVAGDCDCGLPAFETAIGRRCLDGTCPAFDDPGDRRNADGPP